MFKKKKMTRKSDDKELQKLIFESLNEGDPIAHSEDEEYYKMIRDVLETEPEVSLPDDFAEQVTLKAVRRKSIFELYKSTVLYFGSFTLLIVASCFAFYFLAKDMFYHLLGVAQNFKFPIIFALVIFGLVQIIDDMLINKRRIKPND